MFGRCNARNDLSVFILLFCLFVFRREALIHASSLILKSLKCLNHLLERLRVFFSNIRVFEASPPATIFYPSGII